MLSFEQPWSGQCGANPSERTISSMVDLLALYMWGLRGVTSFQVELLAYYRWDPANIGRGPPPQYTPVTHGAHCRRKSRPAAEPDLPRGEVPARRVDFTAVHRSAGFQVGGNTREIWWQVLNTGLLVVGSLSREGSGRFLTWKQQRRNVPWF